VGLEEERVEATLSRHLTPQGSHLKHATHGDSISVPIAVHTFDHQRPSSRPCFVGASYRREILQCAVLCDGDYVQVFSPVLTGLIVVMFDVGLVHWEVVDARS
jgi:hypothetical protein